jgi:hypothetical protein
MRGDPAAARAAVEAALAHAAADPRPHRRMLRPGALRGCAQVLRALGDGRAAELEADWWARRDEQLRSLADDDARRRLLEGVPHWRDPALGPGAPAAGRP